MDADAARASIQVAVRIRPFTHRERAHLSHLDASSSPAFAGQGSLTAAAPTSTPFNGRSAGSALRKIVKGLDDRVLVFDPPESNPTVSYQRTLLGPSVKKVKDIRFCFDRVFEETASQKEVYDGSAKELVPGVLDGFNSTVFAYGATGCGKTHTISGSPAEPGIIFLLMKDLFDRMASKKEEMTCEVSISYLEIYNENIRDLLIPNSPATLGLRESDSRVVVPGLTEQTPTSAEEVVNLIMAANANRTVNATEANAVSSRSHAVLCVNVKQKPRTAAMSEEYTMATLSVIDLAGSERASVTKNSGERLIEGANINRSLLALGNCINALCDVKKSANHVPYRDSKLTRLLKHSLGGNCRTLMIVCVSPSSGHYDETFNTLQYANRAKEIKTKVTRNVVSVDRHVSQYVKVIYELRQELESRKSSDGDRENRLRDKIRQEREKAVLEVDEAVNRIRKAYEADKEKLTKAGRWRADLAATHAAFTALSGWKSAVFADDRMASSTYTYSLDNLSSTFSNQARNLTADISHADNATSMFGAMITSVSRKISNPSGSIAAQSPELVRLFEREIRCVELEIMVATNQGTEEGRAQVTQLIESVNKTVGDVRTKVQTDLSITSVQQERAGLEALLARMDSATQIMTASFFSSGLFPSSHAGAAAFSMTDGNGLGSALSKKRTAAMRSPNPDTSCSASFAGAQVNRPGKAQRPSLAVTSANPASPPRTRRSPRKPVVTSGSRPIAARPSLKPSLLQKKPSTSSLAGSNGAAVAASGSMADKKEKKGIIWKDDAGEQLTEEHSKSMIDWSDASADMSGSNSFSGSSIGQAQSACKPLRAPGRTTSMSGASTFARKQSGPAAPLQGTILEEEEGAEDASVSLSSLSVPTRILQDIGNESMASSNGGDGGDQSFGSDTTATNVKPGRAGSGIGSKARSSIAPSKSVLTPRRTVKPLARRTSQIGPIRSAKKNRRTSYIDASNLATSSTVAGSATSPVEPRRASRTTISFQQKQAAAAERRSSLATGSSQPSAFAARILSARQKRESMAASNGFVQSSSGPSGSGRSFDVSLDLSGASRPPAWK